MAVLETTVSGGSRLLPDWVTQDKPCLRDKISESGYGTGYGSLDLDPVEIVSEIPNDSDGVTLNLRCQKCARLCFVMCNRDDDGMNIPQIWAHSAIGALKENCPNAED